MQANIRVIVTYPYGYGGPFDRDYPPNTPITTVRDAAMEHFRLSDEPETTYQLTAHDERVGEMATIGQVAGETQNVALKLVKG